MFAQFKRLTWHASLLATVVSMLGVTIAFAASGDLDTTFSGDGKVTTDISGGMEDGTNEIALQTDGKIVVAGWRNDPVRAHDFAVVRYNSNGSLDTTFSGDGKLLTNFGGMDNAEDVAIQTDGKIVVGGTRCLDGVFPDQNCDVILARYTSNGALDPTFSGDGKVVTDFGGSSNGFWGGLAFQPDGKLVTSGWIWNGVDSDFVVYRYNTNGALDTSFSGDGRARINFGAGPVDWADGLALQADGKIVVGGFACDNINFENCDFAVARLNTNGALDTTFSVDGKQSINFGGNDFSDAVALQSNGKIILSGGKNSPTTGSCALVRLNSNGILDTTFSGDGRVVTSFGPGINSGCSDVRVQTNGKIVAAGSAGGDLALVRYNANGTLDTTFSTDGRVRIDFGSDASAIAIQSNGRIVVAGDMWSNFSQNFHFGVFRYLSDGSLDTTFGKDGVVRVSFGAARGDFVADLAIQSDGKIVVVGDTFDQSFSNSNFAIARLNRDGTLDTTFSGDGRQATFSADSSAGANALAIQPDGKIMVVGSKELGIAMVRYNSDGTLDTTFSGTGKKVFSFAVGEISWATDVAILANGKFVIVGTTRTHVSNVGDFMLVRLNSDGTRDISFSGDGRVRIDFGAWEAGSALILQPADGKYVLGGDFGGDILSKKSFALARVLP